MKKVRQKGKDELRVEYKRSDFNGPLIRGKYAMDIYKILHKGASFLNRKDDI